MDGASTDGTTAIIGEYRPKLAYAESKPDMGQSHAINKGFKKARGKYVTWLCADDVVAPGVYKQAATYMDSQSECAIVYGKVLTCNANLVPLDLIKFPRLTLNSLLRVSSSVSQPGSLYRKEVIEEVGGLNEDLHCVMDLDLYLRVVEKGYETHDLGEIAAKFRLMPGSKSNDDFKGFQKEKRIVLKRYGARSLRVQMKIFEGMAKSFIKLCLRSSGSAGILWWFTAHLAPKLFSDRFRGRIFGLLVARHFGNIQAGENVELSNPETIIVGRGVTIEACAKLSGPMTIPMNTCFKADCGKWLCLNSTGSD